MARSGYVYRKVDFNCSNCEKTSDSLNLQREHTEKCMKKKKVEFRREERAAKKEREEEQKKEREEAERKKKKNEAAAARAARAVVGCPTYTTIGHAADVGGASRVIDGRVADGGGAG